VHQVEDRVRERSEGGIGAPLGEGKTVLEKSAPDVVPFDLALQGAGCLFIVELFGEIGMYRGGRTIPNEVEMRKYRLR
jgi:hypothetical protein